MSETAHCQGVQRRERSRPSMRAAISVIVLSTALLLALSAGCDIAAPPQVSEKVTGMEFQTPAVLPVPLLPKDGLRFCIAIDPGHGGEGNPGCVFGDAMEKDLNLFLAFMLRDVLEDMGYRVVLTRTDDTPVDLPDRPVLALAENADIFISIHHNSQENGIDATGIETLYNDGASPRNPSLAASVQKATIDATQAVDRGTKVRNELAVLTMEDLPACLVEVGFLSSPEERALLVTDNYRSKLARGIARGIDEFLSGN